MKITISKSQWEEMGKKAGWTKKAQTQQVQPQTNALGQQVVQQGNIGPGSKYNAIVQQMPQIKQMVDWLNLTVKNQGKLDPSQEKQVRATQSNLINAFKQMKLDPMQYPEVAQVIA